MNTKNKYIIILIIFSLFSFQSIGYDLYAHSVIHHFNYEKITYVFTLFNEDFIIPRYGLLSYLYEFSRYIGIPIGWIALALVYVPVFTLSKITINYNYHVNRIIYTILGIILMVLIYFYSAMSLVIIWFLALILTRNKIFLIGTTFHPAGFLLGLLYAIIFSNRLKNLIIFIFPFAIMAFLSYLNYKNFLTLEFIDSENKNYSVEISLILELIKFILENKPLELSIGIIIFVFGFLCKRLINSHVFFVDFQKKIISQKGYILILVIPYLILMMNSIIRDGDSLFLSIMQFKYSDNIYITWFNFGERDYVGSFHGVNNERF